MKVLHLSNTPLVGAPLFWSECFNQSGLLESRCYSVRWAYADKKSFPHDVETAAEALELMSWADRVIVHNRRVPPFQVPKDKLRVAIHSTPSMVDKQLLADAPKIGVLAQMHPRFYRKEYKDIHLLPNLVNLDRFPAYPERNGRLFVGFSPSNLRAYSKKDPIHYMNTKEVEATQHAMSCVSDVRVQVWSGMPWEELMRQRQHCDVVIDEVATGSYHRTSLEAAASTQIPINNADEDTLNCMAEVSGSVPHPFLLATLGTLTGRLTDLAADPLYARGRGVEARLWVERFWDPTTLIKRMFLPFLE